jgi:hypothetical protein
MEHHWRVCQEFLSYKITRLLNYKLMSLTTADRKNDQRWETEKK